MRHILFLIFVVLTVSLSAQPQQQTNLQINYNPQINTDNQINQPHGGLGNEDLSSNDAVQEQQAIVFNEVAQISGTVQVNSNVSWGSSQLTASSANHASASFSATKHTHHAIHKKKKSVVITKIFSKKFHAKSHYSGKHRFTKCHSF